MWSTTTGKLRDMNTAAEEPRGWHIPRPSLWCADPACPCHASRPEPTHWPSHPQGRASTSSQGSSNVSTQSGTSGSLLLTVANLAALRNEPVLPKPADTASLASSTHFTVVNGLERRKAKPLPSCCWHSHQLTALVVAMSLIFLVGILLAVLYLEMRWREIHMFE